MATPLGNFFSTNKKVVSQCDDKTLRFVTEMLVIQFNKKVWTTSLLGNTSPLWVRKHKKVSIAKAHLANSLKHASDKANEALTKPIAASYEANKALCKPVAACAVSGEARIAIKLVNSASSEAIRVFGDNNILRG